jgi:hypothetical protein
MIIIKQPGVPADSHDGDHQESTEIPHEETQECDDGPVAVEPAGTPMAGEYQGLRTYADDARCKNAPMPSRGGGDGSPSVGLQSLNTRVSASR